MSTIRKSMFVIACLIGGTAGLFISLSEAQAATATATIAVSATITSLCTITALPLAFGAYTYALVAAQTTLTVTCTAASPYNVGLNLGLGTGATIALRQMTSLTSTLLGYNLYQDAGHATVWGPTIGTNTETGTGTGLVQTLTVYGQIAAAEYSAPGVYTDTVTATITY